MIDQNKERVEPPTLILSAAEHAARLRGVVGDEEATRHLAIGEKERASDDARAQQEAARIADRAEEMTALERFKVLSADLAHLPPTQESSDGLNSGFKLRLRNPEEALKNGSGSPVTIADRSGATLTGVPMALIRAGAKDIPSEYTDYVIMAAGEKIDNATPPRYVVVRRIPNGRYDVTDLGPPPAVLADARTKNFGRNYAAGVKVPGDSVIDLSEEIPPQVSRKHFSITTEPEGRLLIDNLTGADLMTHVSAVPEEFFAPERSRAQEAARLAGRVVGDAEFPVK